MNLLAIVPWPYRWLALALLVVSVYVTGRVQQMHSDRDAYALDLAKAAAKSEEVRVTKQAEINAQAKAFASKAAKTRVVTQTVIREVEKYVPNTLPMLPGDFRLYHDAAAAGEAVDDSRRADAAPVAPKDVAQTISENYAACLYDQQRLGALQQVIKVISE
jgi:hypothetical protein